MHQKQKLLHKYILLFKLTDIIKIDQYSDVSTLTSVGPLLNGVRTPIIQILHQTCIPLSHMVEQHARMNINKMATNHCYSSSLTIKLR